MFMGRAGKLKLLFLLGCLFASFFVLANVYADQGKDQALAKAMLLAQNSDDSIPTANYRQELGKTIVVEEEYFPHNLDSYVRSMPLTGAKSQSGKVGLIASAAEYNYKIKLFDKIPIEFGVATKYIGINNSTVVKLPAKLTSFGMGVETTLPFFNLDKTYFTIALAPSFYSQNWNFRSDSFHLLQNYFLIYQPNEKLTLVLGANYSPGFKAPVSPIAGFIYRPNDRLTFNLIPSNPEISYDLNGKWTAFVQGGYVGDEYKVTQNGLKNVVLDYNEIRGGAGLRYSPNKHIEGSLSVGGVFNRSIEYRQDSLGKVALENGFYSEFRLSIMI